MRRSTIYSSWSSPRAARAAAKPVETREEKKASTFASGARAWLHLHEQPLYAAAGALVVMLIVVSYATLHPPEHALTQKDVQKAIEKTLSNRPSISASAYEAVRGAVVMVRGLGSDANDESAAQKSVGSGVVIIDSGIILTNLHVVVAADRLQIVFADGTESDAEVMAVRPEQDLAVLKASTLPDDLQAATLGSTADLQPGDEVVAVGFPFGIGPSVSAGIVSGLKREHRPSDGGRALSNLIQFDAAANPGNSGGPLVTAKGEVVGIVTGILNPTEQRVFIGIGFAVPIESAAQAAGQSPF